MSIVSSTHTIGHAQPFDRHDVIEVHTDHLGVVHIVQYLAASGTDYVAVRTARALQIEAELAEAEALALLGG